jgi:O-acetyl-ADP-ribose deacetylase (regulator of RNase III)
MLVFSLLLERWCGMPLEYVLGNLFSAPSSATLVIPVNCRGVAGVGLAKQCRERYPEWFHMYRACCQDHSLRLGVPLLYWGITPWIVSFPTKDDWRFPSRLDDIGMGLRALRGLCLRHGLSALAVPKLGCGAGGLAWSDVEPLIVHHLGWLPTRVMVYL